MALRAGKSSCKYKGQGPQIAMTAGAAACAVEAIILEPTSPAKKHAPRTEMDDEGELQRLRKKAKAAGVALPADDADAEQQS